MRALGWGWLRLRRPRCRHRSVDGRVCTLEPGHDGQHGRPFGFGYTWWWTT